MTTVINTNVPAIIAKSNMDRVQRELENSINKLSSGSRIIKRRTMQQVWQLLIEWVSDTRPHYGNSSW